MKGEVLGEFGLHMAAADNVVTAIDDLTAGTKIPYGDGEVELVADVPFGHKVALVPIDEGETVVKYGETIGRASQRVAAGEWVHTHNCDSTRGRGDLAATEGESA